MESQATYSRGQRLSLIRPASSNEPESVTAPLESSRAVLARAGVLVPDDGAVCSGDVQTAEARDGIPSY